MIFQQMELEDASLAGQQVDELDMHSLYQGDVTRNKNWLTYKKSIVDIESNFYNVICVLGGRQKHWT